MPESWNSEQVPVMQQLHFAGPFRKDRFSVPCEDELVADKANIRLAVMSSCFERSCVGSSLAAYRWHPKLGWREQRSQSLQQGNLLELYPLGPLDEKV